MDVHIYIYTTWIYRYRYCIWYQWTPSISQGTIPSQTFGPTPGAFLKKVGWSETCCFMFLTISLNIHIIILDHFYSFLIHLRVMLGPFFHAQCGEDWTRSQQLPVETTSLGPWKEQNTSKQSKPSNFWMLDDVDLAQPTFERHVWHMCFSRHWEYYYQIRARRAASRPRWCRRPPWSHDCNLRPWAKKAHARRRPQRRSASFHP